MADEEKPGTSVSIPGAELDKEAAKLLGKLLEPTAGGVGEFVATGFAGLLGDRIREWRNRKLIDLLAGTAKKIKSAGISIENAKALPMGELYSLFDSATKQDDPVISEMWSSLLAGAVTGKSGASVHPSYVEVLNALSGTDARILEFIWQANLVIQREQEKFQEIVKEKGAEAARKDRDERYATLRGATEAMYQAALGQVAEQDMERALSRLLLRGCIQVPIRRRAVSDLLRQPNLSYNKPPLPQTIDPRALVEVLGGIEERERLARGGGKLPPLWERNPLALSYSLTPFGSDLMGACHVV